MAPRLLISDDNAPLARALGRLITQRMRDVEVVIDTDSRAPELALARPPAVIVMDLFQTVSGVEQLRALKANPQTRSIPVLVVTAIDRADSRDTCLQLGAAGFYPKPFPPELPDRIVELLQAQRSSENSTH